MATEITTEDIATAALEAQSATADGQSVTAHNLKELRETSDWLERKEAAPRKLAGIRIGKFIHGGARPR